MEIRNFRRSLFCLLYCFCGLNVLKAQISFEDISEQAGIAELGPNYGVAVMDYNRDGFDDIYIARWIGEDRLYKNNGDGTFREVSKEVGLEFVSSSKVATWGDINNDGWPDLFVGSQNDPDILFLNLGESSTSREQKLFERIELPSEAASEAGVMAAIWADIDQDSFLDLYVVRLNHPNTLYKNNGDQTFSDQTREANVEDNLLSMGAIFFDYDNDGDQDLYLVHDGYEPNILYQNDGKGHFQDVAPEIGADSRSFGMGVDVADINQDGWLDIYISNQYGNTLLLNKSGERFEDISIASGTTDQGMGWGTAFLDFNNDSWQDIYVANTIGHENVLYKSLQDLTFQRVSDGYEIALGGSSFGMATLDITQDGKVDFCVANSQDEIGLKLFENIDENTNNWLAIKCEGTASNQLAIGTRIEVWANGIALIDEIQAGSGYAGQNSLTQHFGLGSIAQIDSLVVKWPSGVTEKWENLAINQLHTVVENNSNLTSVKQKITSSLVKIYPNPSEGIITIEFEQTGLSPFQIDILNNQGQVIYHIKNLSDAFLDKQPFQLDLREFSSGSYWLRLTANEAQYSPKVFILK